MPDDTEQALVSEPPSSDILTGKALEKFVLDYMARPSRRRFKYMYTGLTPHEHTYVFGDTDDELYEFCESSQSTGLVYLKDPVLRDTMLAVLEQFSIDAAILGLVRFDVIVKALASVKWDLSQIKAWYEDDTRRYYVEIDGIKTYYFRPLFLHFFSIMLAKYVEKYYAVFIEEIGIYHDILVDEPITTITSTDISGKMLTDTGLYPYPCKDIRLLSVPGHDAVDFKTLIKKVPDHSAGLRIWGESGGCLNFGSYFVDDTAVICSVRNNILIFPQPTVTPTWTTMTT